MFLIKLPFKILVGMAALLLSAMILLLTLFENISACVAGLAIIYLAVCAIWCATQSRWTDVGILAVMAVVVFVGMLLVEVAVQVLTGVRDALK